MKVITCLAVALAVTVAVAFAGEQQQQHQRVLRRVIKSTPTATNLARVRLVHVRSTPAGVTERGDVAEISSKEAANFGQRSANETSVASATKSAKPIISTSTSTSTTSQTPSTTSTQSTPTTTVTEAPTSTSTSTTTSSTETPEPKNRANERQQQSGSPEVELLASAPSSWQMMTAVEAPAAMLIATGTRAAAVSTNDLSSSSSNMHSLDESTGDFLRASATKGGASYTQHQSQNAESFSRLRQHLTKQTTSQVQQHQQQQQSFFYPQQQQVRASKTNVQATKTNWYQPPSTTTPRPAPLIQQQEQQYEQQNEQYVEQQQQQQQVEYGPAPLGQAEPFAFDFRTQDNNGNGQYRKEESDKNGVVRGSYGYTDANGIYRHVDYVADHNGFRANIKSNEPGLIGETQPASIQLAGGATPPANNQRLTAPEDSGDWATASASNNQGASADLALAPPNFESSHKSERLRSPRNYHN